MKIASIDIETTGLDPERFQVLEFACILADLPGTDSGQRFHRYVLHKTIYGDPFAVSMHPELLRRIATRKDGFHEWNQPFEYVFYTQLANEFHSWLINVGMPVDSEGKIRLAPAGKNYAGFDHQFLRRLPDWEKLIRMQHRAFDPAVLYFDPDLDETLPSLTECVKRARKYGCEIKEGVSHEAMSEALQVLQLLRHKF